MATAFSKLTSGLMVSQALTAALEVIINKTLTLETASVSLEKLTQKTITLELTELGFPLSFTVGVVSQKPQIIVTTSIEHSDCTIKTSLKTLQALKAEQQLTELIKQDKLDLTGDIKVAQEFTKFAENLAIDWQSELANIIGDIPTYKLTQLSKQIASKAQFAAKQINADASEYIVHEKRLLVTSSQINHFNLQVCEVSDQVDALELRISKLINHKDSH